MPACSRIPMTLFTSTVTLKYHGTDDTPPRHIMQTKGRHVTTFDTPSRHIDADTGPTWHPISSHYANTGPTCPRHDTPSRHFDMHTLGPCVTRHDTPSCHIMQTQGLHVTTFDTPSRHIMQIQGLHVTTYDTPSRHINMQTQGRHDPRHGITSRHIMQTCYGIRHPTPSHYTDSGPTCHDTLSRHINLQTHGRHDTPSRHNIQTHGLHVMTHDTLQGRKNVLGICGGEQNIFVPHLYFVVSFFLGVGKYWGHPIPS